MMSQLECIFTSIIASLLYIGLTALCTQAPLTLIGYLLCIIGGQLTPIVIVQAGIHIPRTIRRILRRG